MGDNMAIHKHICEQCSKHFEDYCETTRFCSRSCFNQYRKENIKYGNIVCPICGTEFKQMRENHVFCSVACRIKSTEKKLDCLCDYCGKPFARKVSEVENKHRHYCSVECRNKDMYWSDDDTQILINNYGIMSYEDMINMFSTPKTIDEIRRRAGYIGITVSRVWSQEDIDILIDNYSTKPIQYVMELLPHKTLSSIRGQAKTQGLKSFYYLSRLYTPEEETYLIDNYLEKSNDELGEYLNREPSAIGQHLWIMGLKRPYAVDNYTNLADYIRSRLYMWKNEIKEKNNYTCALTGSRRNIIVHHIYGFNLLLSEVINNLNFPVYDDLTKYTQEQLDGLTEEFFDLQEYYGQYVCITEDVHKHFHSIYGYGNNTQEQWDTFVSTYYKN